MRNLSERVKLINLIPAQDTTATVTGSAVDIEIYEDDALALVSLGTFTSNPTIVVTIVGSLVATPTVYDQTLATFATASATGVGAKRVNLAGIKNIKGVSTLAGGTSPHVPVCINLITTPTIQTSSLNSGTIA